MHRAVPLILTLACACAACHAQPNGGRVVLGFDFEKDLKPWYSLDTHAKLDLTTDAAHVRSGAQSLQFAYTQRPPAAQWGPDGIPGGLMATLASGAADATVLHFSIRAQRAMPLVAGIYLPEGSYASSLWVPADKWLDVDLPTTNLIPDPGNDAAHSTSTVNMAQVAQLALVDGTPMLTLEAPLVPYPLSKPTFAAQAVWLDDVNFVAAALPAEAPAHPVTGGVPVIIDTCRHKFAQWVCFGGDMVDVSETPDEATGPGLRASYTATRGTAVALIRSFKPGLLQKAKRLDISLKVSADSVIDVILAPPADTTGAAKSNAPSFVRSLTITASQGWRRFTLPLVTTDPMKPAPTPVDASKFGTLMVVDRTAAAQTSAGKTHANVLQVDDVVAVK